MWVKYPGKKITRTKKGNSASYWKVSIWNQYHYVCLEMPIHCPTITASTTSSLKKVWPKMDLVTACRIDKSSSPSQLFIKERTRVAELPAPKEQLGKWYQFFMYQSSIGGWCSQYITGDLYLQVLFVLPNLGWVNLEVQASFSNRPRYKIEPARNGRRACEPLRHAALSPNMLCWKCRNVSETKWPA